LKLSSLLSFVSIFILLAGLAVADDEYRPYLHKANVPDNPGLKLYGSYKTNLFPGAATYSYPIEIPAGTNGLQPSISIAYNSQNIRQHSILGAGWQLSRNYVYRDVNSTFSDSSDDFFVLVLGGVHELAYGKEYRVKYDNFLKVSNVSTGWHVRSKDGTLYNFSTSVSSDYGYVSRWYLDNTIDVYDNSIFYSYLIDPSTEDSNAVYVNSITYNNDLSRQINFTYEDRQDRRSIYTQGLLVDESSRLSNISVYTNDVLVRQYGLNYKGFFPSVYSLGSINYLGSDGSLLHSVNFTYHNVTHSYLNSTTEYRVPDYFSETAGHDYGVRLVDLNNDGFIDIIKGYQASSEKKAWLNDRNGSWVLDNAYAPPRYMADSDGVDEGVRFVDLNNDGLQDFVLSNNKGSVDQIVYLNNGSGWVNASYWNLPVYFIEQYIIDFVEVIWDNNANLVDLNGDGKVDILQSSSKALQEVYLNNGSGWIDVSDTWKVPTNFSYIQYELGARLVDLNGDGLTDIIRSSSEGTPGGPYFSKNAWLNNGSGFVEASYWTAPIDFRSDFQKDEGARFVDLNQDGLVDIQQSFSSDAGSNKTAWLNNGSGWTRSNWTAPESFILNKLNLGKRIGDVDGDGFADLVTGYRNGTAITYNYTLVRNSTYPVILKAVINEYGGVTEIDYSPSTSYDNTGNDSVSDLGFNVWVVDNVTVDNSLSGEFSVLGLTNYSYLGGLYDYEDLEFRGFSLVTEQLNDNSSTLHYFHQSDALKGKEFRTMSFGNSLFQNTSNTFSFTSNASFKIFLDSTTNALYDTHSISRITRTNYTYDDYGNVFSKISEGDVNIAGDEKYEYFDYVYNDSVNIVSKVKRYRLYGSDNLTLSKEIRNNYDGLDYGLAPTHGSVTETKSYLDTGADPVVRYTYDSFGNLNTETDARGFTTSYLYGLYDPTNTYVNQITNSLGHRRLYNYDLGTGNLLWDEKNGIRTSYKYDSFGRKTKDILTFDSETLPTKEYVYTLDGTAPEIILVKDKTTSNKTQDTYFYYDGMANLVQLKREADDNRQIVKNIFYDGQFRVKEEDNPYFDTFSTGLSTPSATINSTEYTYDALSRITTVTNPDDTTETIVFNKTTITTFDANNHKKEYVLDGHDRIKQVIEYNNEPEIRSNVEIPQTTHYEYDTQDNLIKITDALGNVFSFTYDTLGRKTAMDDPDLGEWSYVYDVNGNLKKQTDNRGKTINLTYDRLNRVTGKITTPETINFTYDVQYQSTLTNLTGKNFSKRFTYDERLRVTKEEKFIDDTWLNTNNHYDSMNRIVEQLLPNNEELEYFYNEQGRINKIRGYMNTSAYNAFDNPLNRTYANNKLTEFNYDSENARLTQIKTDTIQQLDYSYDNVGNVFSIEDPINVRDQLMSYDFLDRLTNVTINGTRYVYSYNEIGNILKTIKDNNATYYKYGATPIHAPSVLIRGDAGIDIYKPKDINTGSTKRIKEFYLTNDLVSDILNTTWTILFGDGNSVTSDPMNITDNVLVFVEYDYASGGDFTINITNSNGSDFEPLDTKFGARSRNISKLTNNQSLVILEWYAANDINKTASVNWDCGNGLITSTEPFNLTNESVMIFIEHNYTSGGDKDLDCQINSTQGNDTSVTNFTIEGVKIVQYNSTTPTEDIRTVSFDIKNNYYPLTASWTITSDGTTLSNNVALGQNEVTSVVRNISYTTGGIKIITVNISSGSFSDSYTERVYVKSLNIIDYFSHNMTGINKLVEFTVKNYWSSDILENSWSLDDPSISSDNFNLSAGEDVMVFIETNYSSQGTKQPTVTATNGTLTDTFKDYFSIEMLKVRYYTLKESLTNTISQLVVRNNVEDTTFSWQVETPNDIITSSTPVSILQNEEVVINITSNYTVSNIGNVTVFVNESRFNDTASGVVVVK
jgi:YD repeat-containing protein